MTEPRYIQSELRRIRTILTLNALLTLASGIGLGLCLHGLAHGKPWPFVFIALALVVAMHHGQRISIYMLRIRKNLMQQQQRDEHQKRPACTATVFNQPH